VGEQETISDSTPTWGGSSTSVYVVREQPGAKKDPSFVSDTGLYTLKKVRVQKEEQLESVNREINIMRLFHHPNLIPLVDSSIISVKEGKCNHEAYMLFPLHLDGTLHDHLTKMQETKTFFPTITVMHIFQQICTGLKHMHKHDPPYAHNDINPKKVLLAVQPNQPPRAVIMELSSATPAHKQVRSRSEALVIQGWAERHCTAQYRAPELWDCPSNIDLDERSDIWSLGCTLFAIMYGMSPFESALGEQVESVQLAVMSNNVNWPPGPNPPYPETLRQFVTWMLQPSIASRPSIEDICIHIDKLIAKFGTEAQGV